VIVETVPDTAVTVMTIMSFVATAVVVKSVTVEDVIAVPLAIDSPTVLMRFDIVGTAVPVATFQNLTVIVPESPEAIASW